jgi:hypothetical protein
VTDALSTQQAPKAKAKLWWIGAGAAAVIAFAVKAAPFAVGYVVGHETVAYLHQPSDAAVVAKVAAEVKEMKRDLPKRYDDFTTWIDVWSVGKQFIYQYKLETDVSPAPPEVVADMKAEVMKNICPTLRGVKDVGITYTYRYEARGGRDFAAFVLSAADCR